MSPAQISLARHALGFDAGVSTSFRNRYFAPFGDEAHAAFEGMCAEGMAIRADANPGTTIRYELTLAGALACLRDGEKLDTDDFPGLRGKELADLPLFAG